MGAVLPWSLREGDESALGLPDVAGPVAVGAARLGAPLSHRAGALQAQPCRTGPPAQDRHGLGAPDAVLCPALAARPCPGGRRRPRLRGPAPAGRLPADDHGPHLPGPPAAGCRPLCAAATSDAGSAGRPRLKGHRLPSLLLT